MLDDLEGSVHARGIDERFHEGIVHLQAMKSVEKFLVSMTQDNRWLERRDVKRSVLAVSNNGRLLLIVAG